MKKRGTTIRMKAGMKRGRTANWKGNCYWVPIAGQRVEKEHPGVNPDRSAKGILSATGAGTISKTSKLIKRHTIGEHELGPRS